MMDWSQLLSSQRSGKEYQKGAWSRSAFEQDYDRIIFSHPFRKLQDKTQVHPLPELDFVHTRLTHSLEVSSAGRSLGKKVGEVVLERHPALQRDYSLFDFGAIVSAAALAHDLGNPPFGHSGEDAISDFFHHHEAGKPFQQALDPACWQELISFEGNAQGFRILNKNLYGLKLTHATLGAYTKYPCAANLVTRDRSRKSQKKYGFFQSEKERFAEVAASLGLPKIADQAWARHPLAFLVEAADDVCYSIIDLEDACVLGLVSFDQAVALFATVLGEDFKPDKLKAIHGLAQKVGTLRALAIRKLIDECATIFLDHEQAILAGDLDKALIDLAPSVGGVKAILDLSLEQVYRSRQVAEIQAAGYEVLPGLLEAFTRLGVLMAEGKMTRKYQNLMLLLPEETRYAIEQNGNNLYATLREIVDFISGLTDRYALSLFSRIKGRP